MKEKKINLSVHPFIPQSIHRPSISLDFNQLINQSCLIHKHSQWPKTRDSCPYLSTTYLPYIPICFTFPGRLTSTCRASLNLHTCLSLQYASHARHSSRYTRTSSRTYAGHCSSTSACISALSW